jgi:excinuclease ABC subunit C
MLIESYDISNISGSHNVGAMITFKNGKSYKDGYRNFKIKNVPGQNDYASMREVVSRRYKRMIEEGSKLPDLIIADGGKGQMQAIRSVVENELGLSIPIAGLVKDGRHRTSELIVGENNEVIGLKQNSSIFRLMTSIQDEVHRFAITFHRERRSKRQTESELDNIKGIGEKSKTALLKHFKSVKQIKNASQEELVAVIGKAKTEIILDWQKS